jgi:hypothetical protein
MHTEMTTSCGAARRATTTSCGTARRTAALRYAGERARSTPEGNDANERHETLPHLHVKLRAVSLSTDRRWRG